LTRNKVEICGVDTSKLPVLTNAEMRELFITLQTGGEQEAREAREKLVNGNLRLVLSIIQRFNNRGEYVDDLFQVGCIGLMKAIDNFDLSQNVRFSTYAVPMIIGEIRRYLRDNNPIRVSRSLRDVAYKALQVRDMLTSRHSREPTIREISEEMNVPQEDIVFALDAIQDPVSLFEPIYHDGGDPIYVMDQISDERNKDSRWIEGIALREAMRKLGRREKMILSMRFFEGKTQMEVADEIGISQAQVSRLEKIGHPADAAACENVKKRSEAGRPGPAFSLRRRGFRHHSILPAWTHILGYGRRSGKAGRRHENFRFPDEGRHQHRGRQKTGPNRRPGARSAPRAHRGHRHPGSRPFFRAHRGRQRRRDSLAEHRQDRGRRGSRAPRRHVQKRARPGRGRRRCALRDDVVNCPCRRIGASGGNFRAHRRLGKAWNHSRRA